MATGYEVQMYGNIARIAQALERIAKALEEWDYEFEVRVVNPPIHRVRTQTEAEADG